MLFLCRTVFFLPNFISGSYADCFSRCITESLYFQPLFHVSSHISYKLSSYLLSRHNNRNSGRIQISKLCTDFANTFFQRISPLLRIHCLRNCHKLCHSRMRSMILRFLRLICLLYLCINLFNCSTQSLKSLFCISHCCNSKNIFLNRHSRSI